jgi:hypothetical protein
MIAIFLEIFSQVLDFAHRGEWCGFAAVPFCASAF